MSLMIYKHLFLPLSLLNFRQKETCLNFPILGKKKKKESREEQDIIHFKLNFINTWPHLPSDLNFKS